MKSLNSVCIITHDVCRLRDFYQNVLEATAEGDDVFVTFSIPGASLSLFSTQGLAEMASGLVDDLGRGNCFLEFEVGDVDKEYERLKELGVRIVKPPTTQTWGVRSVWFRDPDGNLINFYTRVTQSEEKS